MNLSSVWIKKEIGKSNQRTALGFQSRGLHQTSPALTRGEGEGGRSRGGASTRKVGGTRSLRAEEETDVTKADGEINPHFVLSDSSQTEVFF